MYNATGLFLLFVTLQKNLEWIESAKLYEVFESFPMKKIAKYGGLPKPTGCV